MSSRAIILLFGSALCGAPVMAYADPDFHVLATFDGKTNGQAPEAALSFDQDGNLYGTTVGYVSDGAHTGLDVSSYGSVFELSGFNHHHMTMLYTFNGVDGRQPVGGLTLDKSGNLFGETLYRGEGPGFVFKLSGPGRQTITDIHDFTADEGYSVHAPTFVASGQPFRSDQPYLSGDLLGNSYAGNDGGNGFLFKLAGPSHTTFAHVVDLGTSDPSYSDSFGSLTPDAFGNVFLTKDHLAGLSKTVTSIAELSGSDHKTYTNLATLDPATTGFGAGSAMAYDRYGNLYGVTGAGGPLNGGTVFELSGPGHHHLTALAAFDQDFTSGRPSQPTGPLLVDYAGNIFGVTTSGGNLYYYPGTNSVDDSGGLIYKISADHRKFTILYEFDCFTDGCSPRAGLVADRSGNIYGTNSSGNGNYGTVFKLSNAGFVPFPQ